MSWWRHQMETFPRYCPFVREIHRSPVNFPHKGQWRGVLMSALICIWINGWVNNCEAGDFRRYRAHYGVIVMVGLNNLCMKTTPLCIWCWSYYTSLAYLCHTNIWCKYMYRVTRGITPIGAKLQSRLSRIWLNKELIHNVRHFVT